MNIKYFLSWVDLTYKNVNRIIRWAFLPAFKVILTKIYLKFLVDFLLLALHCKLCTNILNLEGVDY